MADTQHTKQEKRAKRSLLILGLLLLAAFLISFSFGRYGVPFREVSRILLHKLLPLDVTWTKQMETAVINIRLPRILLACLVGCCLSAAGACFQAVFQNPMASPDILGASNGAAFGAALAILLGAASFGITVSAFAFSILTVMVVFLIARLAPGHRVMNLILAGIMISSLFSAGTSYLKLVADPSNELPAITYWLMGSLSGAKLRTICFIFPVMLSGLIVLFLLRWRLNLLTLGEEEARALGVHTGRVRFAVIFAATLITAASVSVSGLIGWVGLVIPHLCRRLTGNDYKYLLPASCLGGALFLLIVDDISRNLLATEIPIGILTAFVGAPFFIRLLLRKGKSL